MFDPRPRVERVGIEVSDYKHFDDVVVFYRGGNDSDVAMDLHQAKYHVRNDDSLTWDALISPAWLGVTGLSLMERMLAAHRSHGGRANLYLGSPWTVHPDDALSHTISNANEGLDVTKLFSDGPRSKNGKARAKLLDHLQCREDELRAALSRFRIRDRLNLERMKRDLDYRLEQHRLRPVGDQMTNAYDDLARKIIQSVKNVFDATELRALLERENLIDTTAVSTPQPRRVGIRSFVRQATYLDEQMDDLLDLLDCFDGRDLLTGLTWNDDIAPRVRDFMTRIDDQRYEDVELHLHCKLSIAYAAGGAVSRKSGTRYAFRQPGQRGTEIWRVSDGAGTPAAELWIVKEVELRQDAPDVAVAVAVSNSSALEARPYVEKHVPSAGRLLILEPFGGVGQRAVRDGSHAFDMGETFAQIVNEKRTAEERRHMLHVLPSVPATLGFTMGRAGSRLGRTQLYEFALERNDHEGYSPSIILNTI